MLLFMYMTRNIYVPRERMSRPSFLRCSFPSGYCLSLTHAAHIYRTSSNILNYVRRAWRQIQLLYMYFTCLLGSAAGMLLILVADKSYFAQNNCQFASSSLCGTRMCTDCKLEGGVKHSAKLSRDVWRAHINNLIIWISTPEGGVPSPLNYSTCL